VNALLDISPAYGTLAPMKWLIPLLVGLLVTGCGGRVERPAETPVTLIPERGGWFCEAHPSGTGWHCVQDPALAADPRRERPPLAQPPPLEAPTDDGDAT
jgi:hypothetical protein